MQTRYALAALALVPLALRPVQQTSHADWNTASPPLSLTSGQIRTLIETEQALAGVQPIATALFPGPLSSFGILLTLENESASTITEMTLDPFAGLGGQGLVFESVFSQTGPVTIQIAYPAFGGGRGPLVCSFSGFAPDDLITLGIDPDDYTNPNFGASVLDLVGTRIELAFADGTRGAAVLRRTDLGNVAAFVTQTFPRIPARAGPTAQR